MANIFQDAGVRTKVAKACYMLGKEIEKAIDLLDSLGLDVEDMEEMAPISYFYVRSIYGEFLINKGQDFYAEKFFNEMGIEEDERNAEAKTLFAYLKKRGYIN